MALIAFCMAVAACGGGGSGTADVDTNAPQPVATPVGVSGFSSDAGGGVKRMVVDASGNVFVAVELLGRTAEVVVRKYAPNGQLMPFGPQGGGVFLPDADRGRVLGIGVGSLGLGIDSAGNIYAAHAFVKPGENFNTFVGTGGVIYRISPAGELISLASWAMGSASALAPVNMVAQPDGTLYFVDLISGSLVRRDAGGALTRVIETGESARLLTDWIHPRQPVVDASGTIYVVDRRAAAVRKVVNGILVPLAGSDAAPSFPGASGVTGEADGVGAAARFVEPTLGVFGIDGNLYVIDREVIRKITPAGAVTTVAGTRNISVLSTGPLPASLGSLSALAVGPDGVLYVRSDQALVKVRLQ